MESLTAMIDTLSLRIRDLLKEDLPFTYCDACLALRFAESLQDTRAAAMLLVREDDFMRKVRACHGCGRSIEMTEMLALGKPTPRQSSVDTQNRPYVDG